MSTQETAREWINTIIGSGYNAIPGKYNTWIDQKRQQARHDIQSCDIPHRKQEAWRYTSIEKLLKQPFVHRDELFDALQDTDIDEWILDDSNSFRLVFANGHCIPRLSNIETLPSEIKIGSLRASCTTDPGVIEKYLTKHPAQFSHDIFSTLNSVFIDDGLFIHIPKNVKMDKPIEVLFLNIAQDDAPLIVPRNLIVLDRGAAVTLIERYASTGKSLYFNNNVTEIYVNDNARLTHYRIQEESVQSHHLGRIKLVQGADSVYNSAHFALGAGWSRSDIDVNFSGKGAHCELNGLYMVNDGQLADFHLNVVHNISHCSSTENFRGILAGKGRAVFDGRIVVEKNAQKTNAQLSNKNLMLSRNAEVDTKPQLEIEADDVKCSHGTTVGQLDPEQMYYLRSRGISEENARRMLCVGFAGEILESLALNGVKTYVEKRVHDLLLATTG